MEAGKLDRRITLETHTTTREKSGQVISTWGSPQEVWANVRYQTAREVFQADQLSALQTVVFTIRYQPDIAAAKMRVQFDGLAYDIKGVTEPERRKWLQLIGEAENNG